MVNIDVFGIFFITFMSIMAVERIYTTFLMPQKRKGIIFEKWTLYPLLISHVLICIFCVIEYFVFYHRINIYISLAGLVLFAFSFFFRKWSSKALGEYESCHIEIRQPHEIIKHGPYKYTRNPRYIANALEVISITLFANAYISLLLALLTYVPFTIYRAVKEDVVMTREIGEEYTKYKTQTFF